MTFEVEQRWINKQDKAWSQQDTNATLMVHELFDLVIEGKAHLIQDVSVDILQSNVEYILHRVETNILYAIQIDGGYKIEKWKDPVGRRLIALSKYYTINGQKKLGVSLFYRDTEVVRREVFAPYPSLDLGEPFLRSYVSCKVGAALVNDHHDFFAISGGGDSNTIILNICKIKRIDIRKRNRKGSPIIGERGQKREKGVLSQCAGIVKTANEHER